jgi:hypothetical protein
MVPIRIIVSLASFIGVAVSVTVIPGGIPKPYKGAGPAASQEEFFRRSAENEFFNNSAQVILSNFDVDPKFAISKEAGIVPSADSFIRGAIQAWGEHLHLVIRPEEVWFTILVQMNFYMNSHAEEIRHLFVDHEGQKLIYIEDKTWYRVLIRFKDEIQALVKVPWLKDWILPAFSTTTEQDIMTANVLMMGLTKAYFRFEGGIICGLPSVTLLGEQKDWELLLAKLERLPEFGLEPTKYAARLRPILSRFVKTFSEPDSAETIKFWNQIVSARVDRICGSPPYTLSGWIGGFYFWNYKGRPFGQSPNGPLTLDNQTYANMDIRELPVGYARAPFIMRDFNNTARYEGYVLAGTLGKKVTNGPAPGYAEALKRAGKAPAAAVDPAVHNTIQPLSGWMLYGPISHNDTSSDWREEAEIGELIGVLDRNFNAGQCNLRA